MERRRHRTSTLSPSNSMLVPYADRRLAVVPPTIPGGWGVQEVPRRDGIRSDTYYHEPESGRKFRSIREVQRYLNGEGYPCRSKSRSRTPRNRMMLLPSSRNYGVQRRMIVSGGKLWRLRNELSSNHLGYVTSGRPVRAAPDILPDGWIVEEVPRRYTDWTDKYYYEPETGQKFRSLVAVEKFLAELDEKENAPLSKTLEEIMENKPLAKVFKLEHHTKSSSPMKKSMSQENARASSFMGPPMKVNWVLASPQGDVWNPFIADTLIPDAVKQQWTSRFMIFMSDGASNFPSSQA
ncbi:hypothetical protein ACS0TY_020991 [Phlomoides rotata]